MNSTTTPLIRNQLKNQYLDKSLPKFAKQHPCYHEPAHFKISRLHLPVAEKCNIYCNFCDRQVSQYFHTSRPGLTARILTPQQALDLTLEKLESDPKLKVVGIAGPGEPLFNENTFRTLELLNEHASELQFCVCTNGLLLYDELERLLDSGVTSITVTLNAVSPLLASKIYHHINYKGKRYSGLAAGELMVRNQLKGIAAATKRNVMVKINTVLIPSINYDHVMDIARTAAELGVYIMNIMPLIPLGNLKDLDAPSCEQLRQARTMAEAVIPQFRLCRQCRADACGVPGLE
jgi:nitrogen fixation protein NifB